MIYHVYFEFYGKKMQADIEADTPNDAKEIVRNKIIFHKIVPSADIPDFLKELLHL